MAKTDILDILRSKKMDPLEFNFENLWIPPMHFYLTPQDVEELRRIATSVRLSSKIQKKYEMIDRIMTSRGFKRFSAGTNRVVYRCLEDTRFLAKIAVDKVGMQDNPLEYENQFLLKPFVTKMFYVSPCGTVGFSERVLPVKNKEEFRQIASDVFDILINKILGVYVVEDVGTRFFMNWGIRMGFGPVLLDYPYVYKLDGDKLFCTRIIPETGLICDGEIDYDSGFNHLVCTKCGKIYLATNLRDDSIDNTLVIRKGGNQMRVIIKRGDQIIGEPIPMDDVMKRPVKPEQNNSSGLVIGISRPNQGIEIINGNVLNEDTNNVITTSISETGCNDSSDDINPSNVINTNEAISEEIEAQSADTELDDANDINENESVEEVISKPSSGFISDYYDEDYNADRGSRRDRYKNGHHRKSGFMKTDEEKRSF